MNNTHVTCHYCHAAEGQPCVTAAGNEAKIEHAARRKSAITVDSMNEMHDNSRRLQEQRKQRENAVSTRTKTEVAEHRDRVTGEVVARYNITREITTYVTDKGDMIEVGRVTKRDKINENENEIKFVREGSNWRVNNIARDARKGNWVTATRNDGSIAKVRLVEHQGNNHWSFVDAQSINRAERELSNVVDTMTTEWKSDHGYADAKPVVSNTLEVSDATLTTYRVGGYEVMIVERETSLGKAREWFIGAKRSDYRELSVNESLDAYHYYSGNYHRARFNHSEGGSVARVIELLLRRAI